MDRLRGPGGCPWDRRQTHASLRGYLLEETYELLEALDAGDLEHVREELGDLLFQVVFHARIAEEEGRFHLGEVAAGIARKLYGRHPHVFEDGVAPSSDEELARAWAAHKRREGRRSVLDGVPRALPALLRAQRVQAKAAQVGFDWGDARGPLEKLEEEIDELRAEIAGADAEAVRSELGDVLFTAVNLARHLGVDAEAALREATERFVRRFRWVEAAGGDLTALSDERLEALWEEAKQRLEGEGG
ncbi:MAG: nucleoside triphosphate pyrophosphohydrolase [Planctomycetota bacterium]|nr:MAG: nucleoside triphosphate pyrophosphohydrolase [Planctomycetota bacterium]